MKRITQIILVILAASLIASSVCPSSGAYQISASGTPDNDAKLVLDSKNTKELPKHFRSASDRVDVPSGESIDLTGLESLNISGSHQFSEKGLSSIKKALGDNGGIIIADLRQESHGFINGIAVSWRNKNNNANRGLAREQVLRLESVKLRSIAINMPVTLHGRGDQTVIPKKVQNEQKLVESMGMKYVRIPVTDGALPSDDMVDYFIRFAGSQPANARVHFHCAAGIGRTTMFMIMYDMIKNAKRTAEEDIIERQILLADLGKKGEERFLSDEKAKFLNDFYKYCSKNADDFSTPWSKRRVICAALGYPCRFPISTSISHAA